MLVSAFNNDDGGHLYKENVVEVFNNESVFFTTMSSFLSPTSTNINSLPNIKFTVYKAPITYLPTYFRLTI